MINQLRLMFFFLNGSDLEMAQTYEHSSIQFKGKGLKTMLAVCLLDSLFDMIDVYLSVCLAVWLAGWLAD